MLIFTKAFQLYMNVHICSILMMCIYASQWFFIFIFNINVHMSKQLLFQKTKKYETVASILMDYRKKSLGGRACSLNANFVQPVGRSDS